MIYPIAQFMNLTNQGPNPRTTETYLEPGRTDMIGYVRSQGRPTFAGHCPGCGKYAKSIRGNHMAGDFWEWTWCKNCGVYEVRDRPFGVPGAQFDRLEMRVARCANYREDLDRPCRGLLFFGPEQGPVGPRGDAPCVECGGRCGWMVADYFHEEK